jgi:hypothetical protein
MAVNPPAAPTSRLDLLQRLLGRLRPPTDAPPPRLDVEALRAAQARLQAEFDRRVTAYAAGLADGRIDIPTWDSLMRQELRRYHLATAITGAGGPSNADADTFRLGQRKAEEQIAYLKAWTQELTDGRFPVDAAARIRQRAKLYGGAANATFNESQALALGLPPMPFQPAIGTDCKSNCKCHWEFVQLPGSGNFDCYWRLAEAEHCATCKQRAKIANPLKVRGGNFAA